MHETPTWWLKNSEWGDSSVQRFAKLNFTATEVHKHERKGHVVMERAQSFYQGEVWSSYCWEERKTGIVFPGTCYEVFFLHICLQCLYSIQTQIVSSQWQRYSDAFKCKCNCFVLLGVCIMFEGWQSQSRKLCPTVPLEITSVSGGRRTRKS